MLNLTLSEAEIFEATGYHQPAKQLSSLLAAGIPADRRPNGSVRVWRHHIVGIAAPAPAAPPRRPRLKSDRKTARA